MKISASFLLICVAVAVSATASQHHAIHRSNVQDNPGKGGWPGLQISGDREVIGSPDDERASRRLPNDNNGSQDARHGFGVPQPLRNGREGRPDYEVTGTLHNEDVVESRRRDTIGQPPLSPFQDEGETTSATPVASNVGQRGAFSGDNGRLGDLRRDYRSGYRARLPSDRDSRSSEEERPENGRRYRPQVRSDDDTRSSEKSPEYGGRYRPRVRSDDDSRSSEESPEYGRRYPPRVRSDDDSRSSEESPEYGRRYRPRVRSDDDSRSSEESSEYGRRYRPRVRSDDDSRSSEEDRPRWRGRRQYARRNGGDSGEDKVRQYGQRRQGA